MPPIVRLVSLPVAKLAPALAPLVPAMNFLGACVRTPPAQPWRTLVRATARRWAPVRLETLSSAPGPAVAAALARGESGPAALAEIRREPRRGPFPTIVLGGFVPDATEQVYLLRGFLSRRGSIYYVNYPRTDFSASLLCAQLDDLVAEVRRREGRDPVIIAVSFGAGLALDWLRRTRLEGRPSPALAGLILISPVCSVDDLVGPGETKPSTLLGRALLPLLKDGLTEAETAAIIERARSIFARMFEAGAQNKEALATLLTKAELAELRAGVQATIAGVTPAGAVARVRALRALVSPASYLTPELLPLHQAPTLILYAEKENSVLREQSSARRALETALREFFPQGECHVVTNPGGAPVQHASLVFHIGNFLPHFSKFMRTLKNPQTAGLR